MKIESVFTVTDRKTGEQFTEWIEGSGQDTIKKLRSHYPKFSKFILEGWEINGNFVRLEI